MAFSIQTNTNAMMGQENLRINQEFQTRTLNRLTSGYRITSSADDAAGLSVANKYRSDTAELMQGVRNANDGISSLQIMDSGLNNIQKILDRMTTLATQSATETFEGDRNILNLEFTSLASEINRQAGNVGLGTGSVSASRYNIDIGVYIGGSAGSTANAQVSVNLGTSADRVDAAALGVSGSTIVGGGVNLIGGTAVDLRTGTFLAAGTQNFTFNVTGQTFTATVGNAGGSGISGQAAVDQLNLQISSRGITASIDAASGQLSFSGGSTAFNVTAAAASAGTGIATAAGTAANVSLFRASGQTTFAAVAGGPEVLTFTPAGGSAITVSLATTSTLDQSLNQINTAVNGSGIYAIKNTGGTGITFQAANTFVLARAGGGVTGTFAADTAGTTITAPSSSADTTGNATSALASIRTAITRLSTVSGKVGTGLNKLQYAIQLAQSQITNFSAAESRIRDADIAAEAANLTKAQVLQQASMAAMAQANSAPQAILSLLRG